MRRQQRRLELEMKRKERVGDKSSIVIESKSDETCGSGKSSVFIDWWVIQFLLDHWNWWAGTQGVGSQQAMHTGGGVTGCIINGASAFEFKYSW